MVSFLTGCFSEGEIVEANPVKTQSFKFLMKKRFFGNFFRFEARDYLYSGMPGDKIWLVTVKQRWLELW